jgi:hypothetical protein
MHAAWISFQLVVYILCGGCRKYRNRIVDCLTYKTQSRNQKHNIKWMQIVDVKIRSNNDISSAKQDMKLDNFDSLQWYLNKERLLRVFKTKCTSTTARSKYKYKL